MLCAYLFYFSACVSDCSVCELDIDADANDEIDSCDICDSGYRIVDADRTCEGMDGVAVCSTTYYYNSTHKLICS